MYHRERLLIAAGFLLALSPLLRGETYFCEDFKRYGPQAPGIVESPDFYVGNDPIWTDTAQLSVNPQSDGAIYARPIDVSKAEGNFDLRFRFCFHSGSRSDVSYFHIVLTDGIREQRIQVANDRIGPFSLARFIPGGWPYLWQELCLKVSGRKAEVYLTENWAFRRLGAIDLAFVPTGVNFHRVRGKGFNLTAIAATSPGDTGSYSARDHFAVFSSLAQPIAGARTARAGERVTLRPAPEACGIRMIIGNGQTVTMAVKGQRSTTTYSFSPSATRYTLPTRISTAEKGTELHLPDAVFPVKGLGDLYVRPFLRRYCSSYDMVRDGVDIIRDWDTLPPASTHPLDVDFDRAPDGSVRISIDGSYVKTLPAESNGRFQEVSVSFSGGERFLVKAPLGPQVDPALYTLVDLSANPRAKAFAAATSTLAPGVRSFDGIPIDVAAPIDSADVAICRQGMGNWALEVEEYFGRDGHDGFPSAIHYRLAAAPYGKAHILFALDPDPAKDAILTIRLAHYIHNGSGGNMVGDATLDFTDGKIPSFCKEVGTVTSGNRKIPLYQASVDLPLGEILDLAARGEYLDFEFVGKLGENYQQLDFSKKPDPASRSAFNIFGVTLEKAPVLIDVANAKADAGNIFTIDQPRREATFTLASVRPDAKGTLSYAATNHYGAEVFRGARPFSFRNAGETSKIAIPLDVPVGYYDLVIAIDDEASRRLLTHRGSFAILPPLGRKVPKNDSPYATWWFNVHGAPGDEDLIGPILHKAGIRKASWTLPSPEAQRKYDITHTGNCMTYRNFNYGTGHFNGANNGEDAFVNEIRSAQNRYPLIDHAMLWHETAPGYGIPEELLGLPVPPPTADDRNLGKLVNETGRLMRKYFPGLTLQIGNSSASIGAVVRPLRGGANPDYYDRIGNEAPSQAIPPERLFDFGLLGVRIAMDAGEAITRGRHKFSANGSWEFTYRSERSIGLENQAEWHMRDILISLAYDYFLISPGIIVDCSNGYYDSLWGASGLLTRAPYLYPKRAYVAYAVLTSVLDGVTFTRMLDTGSKTVYALEYKRLDGKTVTALWAARGEVAFRVDSPTAGTVTRMYGDTAELDRGLSVVAGGTAPVYVVTDKPLAAVSIAGRSFARDEELAAHADIAGTLDDSAKIVLAPEPGLETLHHKFLPLMKPSTAFSLKNVLDEEKGPCVELTLDPTKDPDLSKYYTEYTTLRFQEPLPVQGKPSLIGIRVKGNSNWGQIRFEIEDAEGEVFRNQSTGMDWGCDIMDWVGNLAVNFDGWGFVYTTLEDTRLVPTHNPGPAREQWMSLGGDKVIDFPIKVRSVTVGMNRKTLNLLDFEDNPLTIRLQGIGTIEEKSFDGNAPRKTKPLLLWLSGLSGPAGEAIAGR